MVSTLPRMSRGPATLLFLTTLVFTTSVLLSTVATHSVTATATTEDDKQTLLRMMPLLQGTGSSYCFFNWNSTTPLCDFNGVTCDDADDSSSSSPSPSTNLTTTASAASPSSSPATKNRRVISLAMANCDLRGVLPEFVSNLTMLQYLDIQATQTRVDYVFEGISMQSNSLRGPLPKSLGQFKHLKRILLYDSFFEGELPSEWGDTGNLRTVQYLLMWNNPNIHGHLPASWGSFTGVESLDVSSIGLTGTLPPEWGKMVSLHTLNLAGNKFKSKLPMEWTGMKSMKNFWVNHNPFLYGEIPGKLVLAWKNLVHIDASSTSMSGNIPAELGELPEMWEIAFRNAHFSGKVPGNLAKLKKLVTLHVSENEIEGPLPDLTGMESLEFLTIFNNKFFSPLPDSWYLPKLSRLEAAQANLVGVLPPWWNTTSKQSKMPSLRRLNLHGNRQLGGTVPLSWSHISFNILDLSETCIGVSNSMFNSWATSEAGGAFLLDVTPTACSIENQPRPLIVPNVTLAGSYRMWRSNLDLHVRNSVTNKTVCDDNWAWMSCYRNPPKLWVERQPLLTEEYIIQVKCARWMPSFDFITSCATGFYRAVLECWADADASRTPCNAEQLAAAPLPPWHNKTEMMSYALSGEYYFLGGDSYFVHGVYYRIFFELVLNFAQELNKKYFVELKHLTEPFTRRLCHDNTTIAVAGSTTCAPCPNFAACNGTIRARIARMAAWRWSSELLPFFPCEGLGAHGCFNEETARQFVRETTLKFQRNVTAEEFLTHEYQFRDGPLSLLENFQNNTNFNTWNSSSDLVLTGQFCKEHFTGPLCLKCIPGYGHNVEGNCVECPAKGGLILIICMGLLGLIIFLAINVILSVEPAGWKNEATIERTRRGAGIDKKATDSPQTESPTTTPGRGSSGSGGGGGSGGDRSRNNNNEASSSNPMTPTSAPVGGAARFANSVNDDKNKGKEAQKSKQQGESAEVQSLSVNLVDIAGDDDGGRADGGRAAGAAGSGAASPSSSLVNDSTLLAASFASDGESPRTKLSKTEELAQLLRLKQLQELFDLSFLKRFRTWLKKHERTLNKLLSILKALLNHASLIGTLSNIKIGVQQNAAKNIVGGSTPIVMPMLEWMNAATTAVFGAWGASLTACLFPAYSPTMITFDLVWAVYVFAFVTSSVLFSIWFGRKTVVATSGFFLSFFAYAPLLENASKLVALCQNYDFYHASDYLLGREDTNNPTVRISLLATDLQQDCSDSSFSNHRIGAWLTILLWGPLLPILTIVVHQRYTAKIERAHANLVEIRATHPDDTKAIDKARRKVKVEKIQRNEVFEFLTEELRNSAPQCYWECVCMGRKLVTSLIVTVFHGFSSYQITMYTISITFLLALEIGYKPQASRAANWAQHLSLGSAVVSAGVLATVLAFPGDQGVSIFADVFILSVQGIVFIVLIKYAAADPDYADAGWSALFYDDEEEEEGNKKHKSAEEAEGEASNRSNENKDEKKKKGGANDEEGEEMTLLRNSVPTATFEEEQEQEQEQEEEKLSPVAAATESAAAAAAETAIMSPSVSPSMPPPPPPPRPAHPATTSKNNNGGGDDDDDHLPAAVTSHNKKDQTSGGNGNGNGNNSVEEKGSKINFNFI